MNGYEAVGIKKPLSLEGVDLPKSYYDPPDPYSIYIPIVRFDLPALARYAKSVGKKMVDVTKEEFEQFVLP
jgi:hypothetical protein